MTGHSYDNLRALLFGEGAEDRPRAPEPALLEYLIPLLPDSLLPRAFSLAQHIWDPWQRADIWDALLRRIYHSPDPVSILTSYLPRDIRRLVLTGLAHQQVEEILQAVLTMDDEWERRELLAELMPQLPAGHIDYLLYSLETGIPDPLQRASVLSAAAPHLASSGQQATLEDALQLVGTAEAGPERTATLVELFLTMVELQHTELAMRAIRVIDEESHQAGLWQLLMPQLSAGDIEAALSTIARYADDEDRIDATLTLSAGAAPQRRDELLDTLFNEANAISDRDERTLAMARLAPHLARAGRGQDALDAVGRMRRGYRDLGHVLAGIAPHLDLPEAYAALALAQDLPRETPRHDALRGVLPRLAELGHFDRARALAGEWRGASRAWLFVELLPHAPEAAREALFTEAMDALNEGELPDQESYDAVTEIAGRLADLGFPEFAIRAAGKASNRANEARALLHILPHLPDNLREEAAGRVYLLAPEIDDLHECTVAIGHTIAHLSGDDRDGAILWARETLRDMPEEWARATLAAELVEIVPPYERDIVLSEMPHAASSTVVLRAAGISVNELEDALNALSPAERETLLTETLDRMADHYAGDEADMEPAPAAMVAEELLGRLMPHKAALTGDDNGDDPPEEVGAFPPLISWLTGDREEMESAEDEADARVVSTGFAPARKIASHIRRDTPLSPGTRYWFWLEVGKPAEGAIDETPVPLPSHLPADARLKVALFGFDGEIEITPGQDVGELQLVGKNRADVARQPASHSLNRWIQRNLLGRRLLFPVRTPATPGEYRLRCNIYYEQVLVQSRLIHAHVAQDGRRMEKALLTRVDYTLTRSLEPAHLTELAPHRLSVMMNDNGNGAHGFHFFGEKEIRGSATVDAHKLQDLISMARKSLRKATWGAESEWNGEKYRYSDQITLGKMALDILDLARHGYDLYDALINDLAGSADAARELAGLMREPSLVQIALKGDARHYVPAALIYDHPLDTEAGDYSLCTTFRDAFEGPEPLEECACFQGQCPNHGNDTIVCPSGFWGYRHALGLPLSLGDAPDLSPRISYEDAPDFAVCVWAGDDFVQRDAHETALQALPPGLNWEYADERNEAFSLMRDASPHVVYFYCHGGVKSSGVPFLQVGTDERPGRITGSNIRAKGIRWGEPAGAARPLVFINGCHTTALEPETAFDFVTAFVETAAASGVIGTEITIFEPLACDFAEEFMRRLLAGAPVGKAMRLTRLALLKKGNPLGLVYIPFALTNLALSRTT